MQHVNTKKSLPQRWSDWLFRQVHTKNLVYNTCWEDPRCDKQLLDLQVDSEVVMITSAGCNALSYLLEEPAKVHCVDVNSRQNALLELKLAAIKNGHYKQLFELFGEGKKKEVRKFYFSNLRHHLPFYARQYWDRKIDYFKGTGFRQSFYYYGTSGTVALFATRFLKWRKQLRQELSEFFAAASLERQSQIYLNLEQKILNPFVGWLLNRHLTMSLVGVPRSQQILVKQKYKNGVWDYAKECFKHVFTQLPIQENYFYSLYFNGKYTADCCPEYLEERNFATLHQQTDKITTNTTTISQFLQENPKSYSHYVLLDHQDWLAANDQDALREEWELILKNSRRGTKILLRSAAEQIDFFPDFVKEKVVFTTDNFSCEKRQLLHHQDRVGTYASVYLGVVQ